MSQEQYIIICDARTRGLVALQPSPGREIQALVEASGCAARVVTSLGDSISDADVQPISDLLHEIMASLTPKQWTPEQVTAYFGEQVTPGESLTADTALEAAGRLFGLCDALDAAWQAKRKRGLT